MSKEWGMTEIKPETIFRRVELPGSRIDDEMVFFDQEAGKYYATGPVGADVWDLLSTPKSFAAICAKLQDLYEIDRATCEAEVRAFLVQMLEAGMVAPGP
jgi:Coenzyme PQQ synthesis protein D (PqqD)